MDFCIEEVNDIKYWDIEIDSLKLFFHNSGTQVKRNVGNFTSDIFLQLFKSCKLDGSELQLDIPLLKKYNGVKSHERGGRLSAFEAVTTDSELRC